MKIATIHLILILGLLSAGPAAAYKRMTASGTGVPLKWTSLPMKFNVHQGSGPGVSAAAIQQAIRTAYNTWTKVSCSYYASSDQGVVNMPSGNTQDHINTNVFRTYWPGNYGSTALGVTWTSYDPNSGKILDADTHFNPNYTWSTTGSSSAIDVQAVATHEIGHQLGLDHSQYQTATMFYATGQGNTTQRSLHSDDIAGVCAIYPSGSAPPPECTSPAHCAPSETCTNNKCVGATQMGYGASCSSPQDCKTGLCLKYAGNDFCSQQCDSQPCPNKDKCLPVTGGGGVNNACLPNSSNMGTKLLGQPCQTDVDCKSNICVTVPGKGYLCSQACSVTQKNCPTNYDCAKTTTGGGLCIPATAPPPPPPPKKNLGETCAKASDCKSNLCANTSAGMVCVQYCDLSKNNCPTSYECKPVSGSTKGVCIKKAGTPPPPKKGILGDSCTKHEDCQSQICAVDGQGKKFCTILCDPKVGCKTGYLCVKAGANMNACSPGSNTSNPVTPNESSGCAVARSPAVTPLWASLLLLALLLRRSRRRR